MEKPPGTSFGTQPIVNTRPFWRKPTFIIGSLTFLSFIILAIVLYFVLFRTPKETKVEAVEADEADDTETDDETEPECPEGQSLKDGVCKQASPVTSAPSDA